MVRPTALRQGVSVAASNLVAVIGVTLLGWPAGALLVVYWVEAGVGVARGAVQALFARREPVEAVSGSMPPESWSDVRGGVALGRLPTAYPRNVPVALSAVMVLFLFWPIAGAVVLLTVESVLPVGSVLLAVGGVFLGQTLAGVAFFREEQYRNLSVRAAMGRRHPAAVAALALGGGLTLLTVGTVPTVLVVGVAVTKTVVELAAGLTGRGDGAFDAWDDESAGASTTASRGVESSNVASAEKPTATFRTDRRSLLFRTAGAAPIFLLLPPYLLATLCASMAGLLGGTQTGLVALAVVLVATVACRLVVRDVARGHREYRVYPDRIVAYDRLLDTPQWSLQRTVATTASVKSSRLDRVRPGGPTVVVTTGDDEHRLRTLRRPAAFVETLGE